MTREQTTIPNIEYTTATGRYDESRSPINLVVLHSTAGTLQSAISLFSSTPQAGKETSAHYIIENDGKLYQGLEEYFTAYHCGNLEKNRRSIGIEHVDNGPTVKLHTDAQYAMSAKLVKDICTFYQIPIDSAHIVPHNSITSTACPNGLDVNRIIREASGSTPPTDDCPAKLKQITEERDRLNGVITSKDETINHLGATIDQKNSELATLQAIVSKDKETLLITQQQLSTAQEQALKVPSLTEQLEQAEETKKLYAGQVTALQTQISKIKSQLVPKKYLSKKLYDIIMALE